MMIRTHILILIVAALVGLLLGAALSRAQTPLTYEAWIAGFGLSPTDAMPLADPDGDGLANLVEFAIANGHPLQPTMVYQRVMYGQRTGNALPVQDPSVITEVGTSADGRSIGLPSGLTHCHVGYEWSPRPNITGVRLSPEYARPDSNLLKWVSGRSAVITRPNPTDPSKMQAWSLALHPREVVTRFFWRLRVRQLEVAP